MKKLLLVAAIMTLIICATVSAANVFAVDSNGNITLNGAYFRVKGGSWFGLEGRYEISNDENNPRGAPMELYMGNVWWASSSRTLATDATEIKNLGFNTIRIPLAPQTLDDNDPQGRDPVLKNTASVRVQGAFTALKAVISACTNAGLYVIPDIHSCSNYLGWRAGRFDAKPPYADANRNNYDFKREDCSCAASGNPSTVTRIQAYDQSKWTANLRTLAGLSGNIMGIDIFNEPWDYTWTEWRSIIDAAYTAVNAVNPNILIFAQGVSNKSPYGDGNNPNWGENLYEAGDNPPTMPKTKLVYSPHTYGPSVCTQDFFADWSAQPQCEGIIEDEFGDAKCQIVIDAAELETGWQEHFGYLKAMGYAICVGEFGGNMDWPSKAEKRHQDRYSYLTNKTSDLQWQNAFVNYLLKVGITDTIYWSINPESSDTYGVYTTPYDPLNNTGGWGTWSGTDSRKLELLRKLWNAPTPTTGPTITPTRTATRTVTGTVTRTATRTVTGTATRTISRTATPNTTGAVVFTERTSYTVGSGSTLLTNINVNVGGSAVASYGLTITYDSNALSVTQDNVDAGDMGLSVTANTNTPGTITVAGFDASGKTGTNLLKITWTAVGSSGTSNIGITVDTLTDSNYNSLGNVGRGASVTIGGGNKGDANDDGNITIVDALMIAQYSVGLPVNLNTDSADTNCDGTINIVDALRVAQYTVGLLTTFC